MNFKPKALLTASALLLLLGIACKNKNEQSKKSKDETKPEVKVIQKTRQPAQRDLSITKQNSYSTMFLDTAEVSNYLTTAALTENEKQSFRDFYAVRNYQYAWFDSLGMDEQALNFMSANRSFFSLTDPKSTQNDSTVIANFNKVLADSATYKATDAIVRKTELQLTAQFYRYAKIAYKTDKDEVVDLNWFVPRKKIDLPDYLAQVLANKTIDQFEPPTPQYQKLKEALKKYADIQKNGGWVTTIRPGAKAYRLGQTNPQILAIKKRLFISGDLPQADTSDVYDANLVTAVNHFARRMGFKEDSAVGPNLLTEMNRSVSWRIKQIIINMERLKWAPAHLPDNYISVNIPEYKLHLYEGGKPKWDMDIVVGNEQHGTIIFSSSLKYVVFSPYWNVPYSIVKHEIGRSAGYLSRHNMEVVGHYSDGLPMVRQKPGGANSLGGVKFLFPNEYAIYFHDTPAKSLFNRDKRAASHGCIRLSDPPKMAAYLLRYDPAWTADSISKSMHLKKEKKVTLPNDHTIAVFIAYNTAWVNDENLYCFRSDIYRYDRLMAARLFYK
jgi:murein L,D-transpeptidase YcbB/YkuD